MQFDYQSREVHIARDEWVTVVLPQGDEIYINGDGSVHDSVNAQLRKANQDV